MTERSGNYGERENNCDEKIAKKLKSYAKHEDIHMAIDDSHKSIDALERLLGKICHNDKKVKEKTGEVPHVPCLEKVLTDSADDIRIKTQTILKLVEEIEHALF